MTPDKIGSLQGFLGALPVEAAARLARAAELDRLSGGVLPHDMILDGLRPRLRQYAPVSRVHTPLRLFCQPFEDLLSDVPRNAKQRGRIARASIVSVWRWLSQDLIPEACARFEGAARRAVLASSSEVHSVASVFWREAAIAIDAALVGDTGRKAARLALGGDLVLADAAEMTVLLAAGDTVREIQQLMPRPGAVMNEDLLHCLRDIYDTLIAGNGGAAPYVAVIAMQRLSRPCEALRLPLLVTRQTQDTLISQTDMGLVGELLFSDLDILSRGILAARYPDFDAERILADAGRFTAVSSAIVKEIEMRRDGVWGQRLMKLRAAVGGAMDTLLERAPREIAAALALQNAGFGPGSKKPDFSCPIDEDKAARAIACARLVAGMRNIAAAASCSASQHDAHEQAAAYLHRYSEDMIRGMLGAGGHDSAETYLEPVAVMTGLLFSPAEAELLRRRARAALSATAA